MITMTGSMVAHKQAMMPEKELRALHSDPQAAGGESDTGLGVGF